MLAIETLKKEIIQAISTIYDPEIPVNVYDLGLIYDIAIDANGKVTLQMTLTAPTCPEAQSLPVQVETITRHVPGVNDVELQLVWDPPWTKDRMSETAQLQLGLI